MSIVVLTQMAEEDIAQTWMIEALDCTGALII